MTHSDIDGFGLNDTGTSAPALSHPVIGYLAGIILTALATVVAVGVDMHVHIPNLSLVFVVPVVVTAVYYGTGPSLFAAFLGAMSFDFFLAPPFYSLRVDQPADIWAICLLFIVGLIVSTVSFASRRTADEAAELTGQLEVLKSFAADVEAAKDADAAAALATRTLSALFEVPCAALLFQNDELLSVTAGGFFKPDEAELQVAKSAMASGDVARSGVYPCTESRFDFWPIQSAPDKTAAVDGVRAVLGVAFKDDGRAPGADALVAVIGKVLTLSLGGKR